MCGNNFLILVFLLGIILTGLIFFSKRKQLDSFDNLQNNLYTYDSCCSQEKIAQCQTYGKTGVCYSNNDKNCKSCVCQNAF